MLDDPQDERVREKVETKKGGKEIVVDRLGRLVMEVEWLLGRDPRQMRLVGASYVHAIGTATNEGRESRAGK